MGMGRMACNWVLKSKCLSYVCVNLANFDCNVAISLVVQTVCNALPIVRFADSVFMRRGQIARLVKEDEATGYISSGNESYVRVSYVPCFSCHRKASLEFECARHDSASMPPAAERMFCESCARSCVLSCLFVFVFWIEKAGAIPYSFHAPSELKIWNIRSLFHTQGLRSLPTL